MTTLQSWDIFMEGYFKSISSIEDLNDLKKLSHDHSWKVEWDIEELLLRKGKVVIVTDPLLSICFASTNLIYMNGYRPGEILGKTPAIFQGMDTNVKTKKATREAIKQLHPFHVSMLNYRKNGSTYICDIEGYPVFNKENKHAHFIAFEEVIDD